MMWILVWILVILENTNFVVSIELRFDERRIFYSIWTWVVYILHCTWNVRTYIAHSPPIRLKIIRKNGLLWAEKEKNQGHEFSIFHRKTQKNRTGQFCLLFWTFFPFCISFLFVAVINLLGFVPWWDGPTQNNEVLWFFRYWKKNIETFIRFTQIMHAKLSNKLFLYTRMEKKWLIRRPKETPPRFEHVFIMIMMMRWFIYERRLF